MKLKVCGMKVENNILDVADLHPSYMGFIFYEKSPRYFKETIPELPDTIEKVGVFVNASLDFIVDKIETHQLQGVQLHGDESPEFCEQLRAYDVKIIKVFSVKNQFDFSVLEPYESVCDYYLFDTKGKEPGGNGYTFNWNIFKKYPSNKSYFLSGGIGPETIDALLLFLKRPESDLCCTLDINSKFETISGFKDIKKIKDFQYQLTINGYGV
ncbi:phosphoribosylanthranilate isomerase [Lacinutrix sp. Hel_I_90]|uniref:phosphoribosylanthranilate isomerase n=1 Tax=Lacinutrix sp. Hel_I_90 TaxID=1249999 RepID=UPI0005CA6DF3|nr:phosphoribosylanthranilate isomerase [Lacinutrix sp. Hel_I_90]